MNESMFIPSSSFFGPDMEPPSGIHTQPDMEPDKTPDTAPLDSNPERIALEKELRSHLQKAKEPFETPSLRMALEASKGFTPEQIAQADRAARSVGIPTKWMLYGAPDLAPLMIAEQKINENALLARWARMSEEHAAFARDDPEAMAGVATVLGSFAIGSDQDAEQDVEKIRQALASGGHGVLSALGHAFRLRHEMAYGENEYLNRFIKNVDDFAPEPPQGDTKIGQLFLDIVSSAPQLAATMAAGAVAGPVGSGLVGAGLASGNTYRDLRAKGVSIDRAGLASLMNATFSAPLESVNAGKILNLFKGKGVLELIRKTGESMISEGGTEYLQGYVDFATGLWGEAQLHGQDETERLSWFVQELTDPRRLAEVHAQSLNDAIVGMFWGGLGGTIRGSVETGVKASQARARANALLNIHDKLAVTKIKKYSPEMAKSMLEDLNPDLSRTAIIPADQAIALYQDGTDIITPLGISEEDARIAANLGQSLDVPLSDMLVKLDRTQMEAAARIMSVDERGMSVADAEETDARLEEDAAEVTRIYNDYAKEQSEYDAERERLRADAETAVASVPGLKAQAESMAGGVSAYTETILEPLEGFARRMEAIGIPRAETLSRVRLNLDALVKDWEASGTNKLIERLQNREPEWFQSLDKQDAGNQDSALSQRFADMPTVEADSSQWFGEGKKINAEASHLRKTILDWAKKNSPNGLIVKNTEQGWNVQITPSGIKASLHHGYDDILARSVPFIPQIVESGIYLDSIEKKPGLMSHIFANKIRLDGKDYVVGFVLREDDNGNRFYDHELTEIINPDWLKPEPALQNGNVVHRTNRGNVMNILRDKLGVNDGTGKILFQTTARGSVLPTSEGYLINLFQRANLSTLPHEFGHIFRMEMQRAVDMGIADKAMIQDQQTFEKWLSRFDDNAVLEAEYNERLKNNPTFQDRAFSSLSPEEIIQVRETAKHEYFARGFEAYLREGKAPTKGLEGAFQRFKNWLVSIYRSALKLGVELSDDVREAFDRMIATERDMELTAKRNELLSLDEKQLDTLGLSGAEREYASGLMKAAIENAAEERRRDMEQARKERIRDYERQAREELLKEPVYAAIEDARQQPLDMGFIIEAIGEKDAEALARRYSNLVIDENGIAPELLAHKHGYNNATALLADMLRAEPLDKAIRERAKAKADEIEAVLFKPEDYLISSDKIQEQVELVARHLTESAGQKLIDRRLFREAAERELAAMPMNRAVNTGRFLADVRRAMAAQRNALRSGNIKAAMDANNKVRLNLEFARQSQQARELQETTQSNISRFLKNKSASADAKFLVMNIAMNHGLGRYNEALARGRDDHSIAEWLKDMEDSGYTFYFEPGALLADARSWRDMTFAEFTDLNNAVKQIATAERNKRKLLSSAGKQGLEKAVKGLVDQARQEYKTHPEKLVEKGRLDTPKKWMNTLHAQLMKVEFICNMLDGGEHGKIWERTIFRPIADAEVKRDMRLKKEVMRMRSNELFGRYDTNTLRQKVLVQTVNEAFTLEQRLMVALNMGNEGNYERLKAGFGWSEEQIADIVASLSKEDWDFVTNVWRFLESFRKEAFAVEKALTGIEPKTVDARPFMTKYGKIPGGYFPVAYDPEKGQKAFERAQKADDKKLLGGRNYGSTQTAHGHLKARSQGGTGEPLDLSFSVIGKHVFDTVHDFTFRIPVMDVAKVLRNKDVQTALSETVGPEMARLFMPWLQDVSMMRRDPSSLWEKSLSKARSLTTVYGLGYKLTVLVQQGTGYLQTIDTIGLGHTARGIAKVFENANRLKDFFNETCELSPFMALRMESFDRDIKDIDRRIIPQKGAAHAADVARDWSMKAIGLCQMGVDLGTWWGAYEKRMQETKGDMRESVAYADSVVRMTQGSGGTKDLARIQRGNEALKLFTMFYSFFNVQYNMWARQAHLTKSARDVPKAMNTVFLTAILGPVLSEILAGRGPDDNDDESWLGWGAKLTLAYPFMTIPGVRDLVNGIAGNYGYQMSPVEQTFKRVVRLYDAVYDAATGEEDWSRAGREAVEIGGILSNGLITQQMVTTGLGLVRFLEGDDFELADLVRRRKRGQ